MTKKTRIYEEEDSKGNKYYRTVIPKYYGEQINADGKYFHWRIESKTRIILVPLSSGSDLSKTRCNKDSQGKYRISVPKALVTKKNKSKKLAWDIYKGDKLDVRFVKD